MPSTRSDHTCLLCGAQNFGLLYATGHANRSHASKSLHNYICNRCGFVCTLPRPTSAQTQAAQELFSPAKPEGEVPDDRQFLKGEAAARTRIRFLESILGQDLWTAPQKTVLEVGCGTGGFLRLMQGCGWQVLGLETNAACAAIAAERYSITIENCAVQAWTAPQKFDLVCTFNQIEQVEDPNLFLEQIHRLLSDDGYLLIESSSIDRWQGETIDSFFSDVQINTFSEAVLRAFLVKAGFAPVATGWNHNRLGIVARKGVRSNTATAADHPDRIRRIVQAAIVQSAQQAETNPFLRFSHRAKAVARQPAQIPTKVQQKIARTFKKSQSATANYSANQICANQIALSPADRQTATLKIAHVGLHVQVNAGDTLLFPAVRWLLQTQLAPIDFTLIPLRAPVTQATIDQINQQDALVIGGGGLFLADSNPNNASGWQWACPPDLLAKIRVPIIVFAVGYNRFRGQSEFAPVFQQSVCQLVEQSAFFSIRNHGSIEALKYYLPEHLQHKIRFQPCPTTVLNRFYPNLPSSANGEQQTLAINIAFDRHHLRFGVREDEILWNLAEALIHMQSSGWRIKLFCHTQEDIDARCWFKAKGLHAEEIDLYQVPPNTVLKAFADITLAVGMRGHAQMIPFGMGCPIYSLISHDKLRFFLEDIHHPEWGIELQHPDLKEQLITDVESIAKNWTFTRNQVLQAQDKIWQLTLQNIAEIGSILNIVPSSSTPANFTSVSIL